MKGASQNDLNMINLVVTHINQTWGSPLNLGDPWRPLATIGDMPENSNFENSENCFVGFFYQFTCRVKRAKRLNEKPDFGTGYSPLQFSEKKKIMAKNSI